MVYIHDFGTITHCPEIGNFSSKTPKIAIFLVLLHVAILSNHKIHHILSEFSCTVNLHDVLYETAQY